MLWVASDNSLDGFGAIVSPHLNGFANVPGCQGPLKKWGGGYGCQKSTPVRRLNIFGPNFGRITIRGPGYEGVAVDDSEPTFGMNAGSLWWNPPFHDPTNTWRNQGSYAVPVVAGSSYILEGLRWLADDVQSGDIIIEFSDPHTSQLLGNAKESVTLTLRTDRGQVTCTVAANDDRTFFASGQSGPETGAALGDCGRKFRSLAGQPSTSTLDRAHRRRRRQFTPLTPAPGPSPASVPSSGSNSGDKYLWVGAPHVGNWGGFCRCPSGTVYQVGDNYDSCGSLACVGGVVERACGEGVISSENGGWKVTCGSADQQQPATSTQTQATTTAPAPAPTRAVQPTTCRTSIAGEECHGSVTWAKETGIQLHPDWYPGLSTQSTFEDFQYLLHKGGHGPDQNGASNFAGCDLPCRTSTTQVTTAAPIAAATPALQPTTCRTSTAGEECYVAVKWAKEIGVQLHADWYPGLSTQSTFEDFQYLLHKGGHGPGQNGASNFAGCDLPC